jgi:ABC-type oligopeptide transport system substrate-binding subunit
MTAPSALRGALLSVLRCALALLLGLTLLGMVVLAASEGEEGDKKDKPVKKKRVVEEESDEPATKKAKDEEKPAKKKRVVEEESDEPKKEKEKPGKKKRVIEEESDDPKPKKPGKEEEEGGLKKKVVRVEEEDEKRPLEGGDLAKAASEASHRAVKALFLGLAEPADEVNLKSFAGVTVGGGVKRSGLCPVKPLPLYVNDPKGIKGEWTLKVLGPGGEVVETVKASARTIQGVRYYERIAIAEVKKFCDEPFWKLSTDHPKHLARFDQLLAAEQALSFVVRFHKSAREREVRKGDGWQPVEAELRTALLNVLLDQLRELTETKAFDQAFQLTRRLAETYTRPEDHNLIAKPLAILLEKAVEGGFSQDKLKEARQRLKQLEEQFPGSKVIEPIRDSLKKQAEVLFEKAKELNKQNKQKNWTEVAALLRQAEETWPELPGLRAFRIANDDAYPILRVSMRELPAYFSPAWAATDADRRAVDLLFESLVNLVPDAQGVLSYHPSLSVGRPKVIPLGREMKLPRNALWSDGRPVTASDVRFTVRLLQEGAGTGRAAAWGELLTEAPVRGDPFRARLLLRQGFLDPLSAMSFKVLPERVRPATNSEEFARKPITSGPFQLVDKVNDSPVKLGRASEDGREYTGFVANDRYGVRNDKLSQPWMKEVRVFAPENPIKALQDDQTVLALDLTAEQAAELKADTNFEVPLPAAETVNRRIYFLAVNHRKPPLANADLRLALALAINREGLLDRHFRKGLDRKVHKSLNGPYPAGSWACNPALVGRAGKDVLDPFDADRARVKLKAAQAKLGETMFRLKLKYPSGDKQLAAAMKELCEAVGKELPGVTLEPDEVKPHELLEDVVRTPSFDLAYWSYDFPDETFWLLPLLGGDNFMGFNGPLVAKIQSSMMLRHFTQVRELAQAIHLEMLNTEMPFIPLWQLAPLYAYRKDRLTLPPAVDGNHIFAQVETWRLKPAAGRKKE